ncbi:PREDICTED: adenylate cyclase type 2 [Ceratosolen solmsi marchali]|uniref:adenylate cyclase n=1 Tax=Ceratosolen solmsi marchali TaxID=326594 RepID=A0AAJ6YNP4_9HYME|nr:PREDICTED: adenylate cyclase type 2 [Ceratosolen solmsi marchali]
MDVELVARNSLSSLQRTVDENFIVSPANLEDWTWCNLRKQFKYKSLEKLYLIYRRKIENGYMSLFVLLQLFINIIHCIVLISTIEIKNIIVDLMACGIVNALLFPVIALSFRSQLVLKESYLSVCLSCLIIVLLVIGDLTVVVYYTLTSINENISFRPVYATHTLLVCYIFLPLSSNLHAFILGITASFCYLASLSLITYRNEPNLSLKITTDVMYHSCVNCLGLYFRFMNEVMTRRSFLDRRKCVESTLRLNYEKDQEEQITRSILPKHFAAKIKENFRDICKFIEEHKKPPFEEGKSSSISKDLYVETHQNVSILYADIVNFSGLTVTLPVKKLVETLNDLFGSFDEASERHNVLRIKFLGDCYYCVSGVPTPNSQHAKSCVDLGLDMISIINNVRARVQRECGVDVNMRIGVHSGKIISGILGTNKWQYDIWSRDVIIANKMEQTGEAGKVHITQQTLNLLDSRLYDYKPAKKLNDDVLDKYGIIQSYLITPTAFPASTPLKSDMSFMLLTTANAPSFSTNKQHHLKCNAVDVYACSVRRKTHFLSSCLQDYHLMLRAADAEMEKAIEQMPLSKWNQWCKWEDINPLFLTFSQRSWEIPYLREPDPLFKFYIACVTIVLIFSGFILMIPIASMNNRSWCVMDMTAISYTITLTFIIVLIPVTWTQFLWIHYNDLHDESENSTQQQPQNKILNFFYRTSVKVIWNEILRIILYFIITAMTAMTTVFNFLIDCKYDISYQENNVTSSISESEVLDKKCVLTPWQLTETCSLAILITFLLLRIHFLLKFCAAITIATFYSWNVWNYRSFIYQSSRETWSPHLGTRPAHILTIIYLTISLHLIDRQVEYLNRLDYKWKRQLTKEQDEAFYTRNANKLLLRNILPEHVADFYLNMDRTEENALYHEAHSNVAVMFATLTDLLIDESNILLDFNEIICQFDKLLFDPNYLCRIEKIKIAGTTYMAVCGLEISRRNSTHSHDISDLESKYNTVHVMVQFAAEMMSILENIKIQSAKPYQLRIGVSHGEVTAGVVGAQKPLYDVWGDAVNMASRMDTTGEPGKIQVTKETAQLLEDEGIVCHLRGKVWVKPKGLVTTYFVGINEQIELQEYLKHQTSEP